MYVMPRSSKSWPGWAKLTTDLRTRWLNSRAVGPTIGTRSTSWSKPRFDCCQAVESLISERYFESAPTEGLIDISLSLRTMSIGVRRWPMSVSYTHLRAHETRHDLV